MPITRLKQVAEALSSGMTERAVIGKFSQEWGLCERQVRRYVVRVQEQWRATFTQDLTASRTKAVNDLSLCIVQALARQDIHLVARLYEIMSRFI